MSVGDALGTPTVACSVGVMFHLAVLNVLYSLQYFHFVEVVTVRSLVVAIDSLATCDGMVL